MGLCISDHDLLYHLQLNLDTLKWRVVTRIRVWRYCIGAVARMIYRGQCRRLPRAVATWNYLGGEAT